MIQSLRPLTTDSFQVPIAADCTRAPQFVAFEFDGSLFEFTYHGPRSRPLLPLFESEHMRATGRRDVWLTFDPHICVVFGHRSIRPSPPGEGLVELS